MAFIRTKQFKTDFFVCAQNFSRELADGDLVSFEFDGEPVRFQGRCPRAYNVMHIEMATSDVRPTDTTSAHDKGTGASDQSHFSIGTQRGVPNKVNSAGVESQSNLSPQVSIETLSKRVEELAKALEVLVQAGPTVTRA